ncbi:MAG TPA: cytochrome P450 [Rugosimonospora sp.]|nr:cytochrome P450 [Rugosimonospora sp.]
MKLFATDHPLTTGVDISSATFWEHPFDVREASFARLRAEAPVSWHKPTQWYEPHDQKGFWAVTRAADIRAVSLDSAVFPSRYGVTLDPLNPDLATAASFFLTMDAPDHTRYRRLISMAFTPKAVAQITDRIEQNARSIVDGIIGAGDIDFVEACASRLPMETVSDIVGVPASQRERAALAAERLVGGADVPHDAPMDRVYAMLADEMFYLFGLGQELAAHRRAHPQDDLLTNLVSAEIDGHRLSDDDIGAFLVLLSVAGNDTTKQTTSISMLRLQANPDQRDWLLADFPGRIGTAVEEFVRHTSPVLQFARTAARDTQLGGVEISAGDKVVLFYCSANRDESVFCDPMRFDLSRSPNPHLGFGGGGAHFCLGNGVARTQLRAIFRELLTRVPRIDFGEPVHLVSNFINGIVSLPAHIG